MNNLERFKAERRPIPAARLALQFAAGCGSKANAWAWADRAVDALAAQPKRQARLKAALGTASWPDCKMGEAVLQ